MRNAEIGIRNLMCGKRLLSLIIIHYSLIITLFASVQLNLKLTLQYDSNVFNLSDHDMKRFEDGRSFDYIKTADDFVQKIDLRLRNTFIIDDYQLTPFIAPSYTNYIQNSDKNSFSLLAGVNTRWQDFTLNGVYGYYPDNYLRKFIDTDGTGQNEDFDYKKMMWRATSSYRFNRYAIPLLYFKFEQYHHNKYFTEYDAPAYTTGVGWRALTDIVNVDFMYYYRTYHTKSKYQQIQELIDTEKDASYESNIYELRLRTKRYFATLTDYRIYTNLNFEQRYYQSEVMPSTGTPYHLSRKDNIFTINAGTDLWVSKNTTLNLDMQYRKRSVDSDYAPVVRDKEYDNFQISTSIEYNFNLFN